MAVIHNTTMNPSKLELLAVWLPAQPWYRRTGREPELARAGGFRLDDPRGEVGIEFMVVTDGAGDLVTAYQVPMTYRAGALAGADGALIGKSEHGVLGLRWLYDGVHDPVLRAQLAALVRGEVQAQAQSASNTADPTVIAQPVTTAGVLDVQISRVLQPGDSISAAGQPCLSASWCWPDGTRVRGVLATARYPGA
jgi:hypothetical protein